MRELRWPGMITFGMMMIAANMVFVSPEYVKAVASHLRFPKVEQRHRPAAGRSPSVLSGPDASSQRMLSTIVDS